MSVRVSCPYCNTAVTLAAVPPSHRTPCPRCGESFPVNLSAGDPLPPPSANGAHAGPYPPPPEPPPEVARPLLPLAIIGGAIGLAVVGIGVVAILFGPSRPPAPSTVAAAKPKEPTTWPPAAVPGLAFAPADANVAAAVQVGPLLAYAARTHTDPAKLLADAGVPDRVTAALASAGLSLDRIDHVAAGLVLADDTAFPRAVVAVRLTATPADEDAILKKLKATKVSAAPPRYKVEFGGIPVEMVKPDPHTFVFATDPKDLADAPKLTGRGSGHLSAGLRESLAKLSPASVAWAAAGPELWSDKPSVKAANELWKAGQLPKRLAGVRAAAAGLSLEPEPRLTVAARGDGFSAAKDLEPRLAEALGPKAAVRVEGEWAVGGLTHEPPR